MVYFRVLPNSVCFQARNKPADGSSHVTQKGGPPGPKAAAGAQKGQPGKGAPRTPSKPPSAQKGQVKTAPPKAAQAAASAKTQPGKKKKGQRHQQYELIVTINLVSLYPSYLPVLLYYLKIIKEKKSASMKVYLK